MNEIYKRRSIRKYTDEPLSTEVINKLLKAGMNAPSAMNKRPWEFIVIDKRDILDDLATVTPTAFMLSKCSVAIAVIGTETTVYWEQDLAAATQNILLEATSLNVASCWIGVAPNKVIEEGFRGKLSVPKDYRILSVITLGYTEVEKEKNDVFDENIIHYNNFVK